MFGADAGGDKLGNGTATTGDEVWVRVLRVGEDARDGKGTGRAGRGGRFSS